ncbi:hypothetical protein CQ13_39055 [Bradyrhizobium retamae]|uniref:Uncharacterized protein n=1 Tax=Bradyrhizobium retamae TaxID=1300035 RepID=A0A0R3NH14_9BRAD|nr:hypothetical protein CQ13_39055 [Bradyrhizobium retamae]
MACAAARANLDICKIRKLVNASRRSAKRLRANKVRTSRFLQRLVRDHASLFVHWQLGMAAARML